MNTTRQLLAVLLAVLLCTVPAAAADQAPNYDSPYISNDYIYEQQMTVAVHDRAEMDSPLDYYDDTGDTATVDATLNDSINNSLEVRADTIVDDALYAFPRTTENTSWINASQWNTAGTNSSKVTVSQANGTTANGVPAVEIATDGSMSAGDDARAVFSNVDITSDAEKRVPLIIGQVTTLDTATEGTLEFVDGDGDAKAFELNASTNAVDADVITNATANGLLTQEKLANVDTTGAGDGTFDGLQEVRVNATEGDLTLVLTGLDADRKSELTLGTELADTDSDDDLEERDITDVHAGGAQAIMSLSSMDATFDDAEIHDLAVKGLEHRASQLSSADRSFELTAAENWGTYEQKGEYYYRFEVPAAIDLSHSGLELRMEQALVSDRYKTFEYIEGASDTDFEDLDEDSFSDLSGQLADQDDTLVLDGTIQPGSTYVLHKVELYLASETGDLTVDASTQQSAGGGFWSGGNPLASFVNWLVAGIASLGAMIGLGKKMGNSGA